MNIRKAALMCACLGLSSLAFGCGDEGGGLFVKCDAGATRCNNDAMEACAIVNWQKLVDCPMGCDTSVGQCKLGADQECIVTACKDSTTLNKCSSDFKITAEACGDGFECVVDKCQAKTTDTECSPNAVKCSADNKGTQTCTAEGKWADVVACEGEKVCDSSSKECVDAGEANICNQGDRECVGTDSYHECADNAWGDAVPCGDNMVCEAGECNPKPVEKVCDEEAKRCTEDNKGFQTCVDNAWTTPVNCAETELCDITKNECVPAAEAKICDADKKECVSENSIKICNAEGKWGEATNCPEDASVCKNDECVPAEAPIEAKCSAGEKKCSTDGKKQLVCEGEGAAADWKEIDCSTVGKDFICDASKECVAPAAVAVCKKGEIKCVQSKESNKYQKCLDDGSGWTTQSETCPGATPKCDSGVTPVACVAACKKDSERCSNDGKRQICENGAWRDRQTQCGELEKCEYDEKANTASCKCTQGTTKCGQGKSATWIQTCNAKGEWDAAAACKTAGYVCSNNECVAPCTAKTNKCVDDKISTCQEDKTWSEAKACGAKEKCVEDTAAKSASCVCEAGAKICATRQQNTISYVKNCVNNTWKDGEVCANGCDEATGSCYECGKDGTRQCTANGVFQICKDHKWVEVEDCGSANSCQINKDNPQNSGCCTDKSNKTCSSDKKTIAACVVKTSDVDGSKYRGWETAMTCDGGECKVDNKGPVCTCKDGSANKCDNNSLMICKNGAWTVLEACQTGYTCDATKNACVCTEGAYQCTGDTSRQICKNNKWEKAADCSKGSFCEDETGVCQTGICSTQSSYCISSNAYISCDHRQYEITTCQGNQVCSQISMGNDRASASCRENDNGMMPNQTRCSYDGSAVETWEVQGLQGKWTSKPCNGYICEKPTNMMASATCSKTIKKVCEYGKYSCDGDKIKYCDNNTLKDVADCKTVGLTCKEGKCVAK